MVPWGNTVVATSCKSERLLYNELYCQRVHSLLSVTSSDSASPTEFRNVSHFFENLPV